MVDVVYLLMNIEKQITIDGKIFDFVCVVFKPRPNGRPELTKDYMTPSGEVHRVPVDIEGALFVGGLMVLLQKKPRPLLHKRQCPHHPCKFCHSSRVEC